MPSIRIPIPPVWLLSALFAAIAPVASADPATPAPPLWDAEVRAGYGVEIDGGQGAVGMRTSPLTVQATVALALVESPRLYGYGGMIVETLDRSSVGAVGGVEMRPDGSMLHVAAGGTWLVAPYSLWGADADVGACKRSGKLGLCGDLELTAYFAGTDLPMKREATQIQLAFGVKFDAL